MATMTFEEALAHKLHLESIQREIAKENMARYPEKGPMGLTPDHIKATPQWKADRAAYDNATKAVGAFNRVFLKHFKKEFRAHLKATRGY